MTKVHSPELHNPYLAHEQREVKRRPSYGESFQETTYLLGNLWVEVDPTNLEEQILEPNILGYSSLRTNSMK